MNDGAEMLSLMEKHVKHILSKEPGEATVTELEFVRKWFAERNKLALSAVLDASDVLKQAEEDLEDIDSDEGREFLQRPLFVKDHVLAEDTDD